MLDSNKTVFSVIDDVATGDMRTQVRNLLGAFLFRGDDIDKKVKVLSGGEKSRLALARMLLQPSNLLILDEPTNHLDMASKDVLKNALLSYDGALILVSHDRDFLNGLTEKTLYFKNNKIKEYSGSIYEFLNKLKIENLKELEINKKSRVGVLKQSKAGKAKLARDEQKRIQKEQSKIQRQINFSEEEIEELETKIADCEELFSDPDFFSDIAKSQAKKKEYDESRKKLNKIMDKWEKLHSDLESVE